MDLATCWQLHVNLSIGASKRKSLKHSKDQMLSNDFSNSIGNEMKIGAFGKHFLYEISVLDFSSIGTAQIGYVPAYFISFFEGLFAVQSR